MTDHVDSGLLAELQALMEDDFPVLLETYLRESAEQFRLAREALASDDRETLRRCAHSLKGSSANIGAVALAAVCATLESTARDDTLEVPQSLLTNVSDELTAVRAQVYEVYRRL